VAMGLRDRELVPGARRVSACGERSCHQALRHEQLAVRALGTLQARRLGSIHGGAELLLAVRARKRCHVSRTTIRRGEFDGSRCKCCRAQDASEVAVVAGIDVHHATICTSNAGTRPPNLT